MVLGSNFVKKRPVWSFIGDFIKILQKLSIWDHFEAKNIDFLKKFPKMYRIFGRFFREKLGPIKQHKPQISENSFLKMQ